MNSKSEGFTLVEILVVVVLGSLIMASVYNMIVMQERSTRDQYAIVETQQNARIGIAILTSELKEISAVDGDVIAADQTSITFRALTKAAVVCARDPIGALYVDVAELGAPFVNSDSILVFEEGDPVSLNDDSWAALQVSTVTPMTVAVCNNLNPLGAVSWRRLTFVGLTPVAAVNAGALLRGFTLTRYRLLDNGEWGQLMRQSTTPPNAAVESPILDRLASVAEGGLNLRYFDAAGAEMPYNTLAANLANIMRVEVTVRGKAVSSVKSTGANRFSDAFVSSVYLRGNFRQQ